MGVLFQTTHLFVRDAVVRFNRRHDEDNISVSVADRANPDGRPTVSTLLLFGTPDELRAHAIELLAVAEEARVTADDARADDAGHVRNGDRDEAA